MNDKSIPQELIDYRRYVLKTIWGGAMYWLAASRGDSEIDSHRRRVSCNTLAKWARCTSTASRRKPRSFLADLQSNGDIQISGSEESILKARRKSSRHASTMMSPWLPDPPFRSL